MKLYLAPLQGTTIAIYRKLYHELFGGIDAYYAPFISTGDTGHKTPSVFKDIQPEFNQGGHTVIPQLLGNNPADFRRYAATIRDMGYTEINWNIGCPFPMIAKKRKGAGLLSYPEMIESFLDEVCKDTNYRLNVKMRLGMHTLEEGLAVMEVLNCYPLAGVIIHARTGIQKYTGTVDLDAFEQLYSACRHEVTYNGDIYTVEDFKRIQSRFPDITRFMLGRGALENPLLPSMIRGETTSDETRIEKLQCFHDEVFSHYDSILSGDRHLLDRMKEFWSYTSVTLDPGGRYMKKIRKCRTRQEYISVIHQMLSDARKV